jgi:hypothetical protein
MTQPIRILRSSTVGHRPPAGTPDGSPYVNFGENQFGVNNAGTNVDLLGIPKFSPNVVYQPSTAIVYQGTIYIANTTVPAGAFNPAAWSLLVGCNTPQIVKRVNDEVVTWPNGAVAVIAARRNAEEPPPPPQCLVRARYFRGFIPMPCDLAETARP